MPRGLHPCPSCGVSIGNSARRCRHCGAGEPSRSSAYPRVYVPGHPIAASDGYALEHRWLLHEMAIPVPRGHHVHHNDGDKHNNTWSNLTVMPAGAHRRHHAHAAGVVKNQYGFFPVLTTDEERRERLRRRNRARRSYKLEWQRRKRAAGS